MSSKPGDCVDGGKLVAELSPAWRVTDDSTQWRLMRKDGERGWVTSNRGGIVHNLLNYIRKHVKGIDPAALAIVQALPGDYRLVLIARGRYVAPAPRPRSSPPAARSKPRRRRRAVITLPALPVPVAAVVAVAAEAPAPPVADPVPVAAPAPAERFEMPRHPLYIRRLAAQFIAWRAEAARHARVLEHA